MAKKKKTYKLDQNEQSNIESFKAYFENFAFDLSNHAKNVDFEIKNTKDDYCITAVADYGKFKIEYFYRPYYFYSSDFIDFRIVYDNCDYKFSIYDIFNLFDIKDFSKYYFDECCTKEEIYIALNKLSELVEKYEFDIEKAADSAYFGTLIDNFENDWRRAYSNDDDEDWKEELVDDFYIDMIHPSFTVNETKQEKLHKRLKKQEAKDKLDTLYERRLLEYLNAGYTVELFGEKEEYDKKFRKNFLLSIAVIYAVCVGITAVIILVLRHFLFDNMIVINQVLHSISGEPISVPLKLIVGIFISGLFLSMTASDMFGKKMYTLITKDNSERARQRFDAAINDDNYSKASAAATKVFGHIAAVVTFVLAVGCMAFTIGDNVALADDYVKYPSAFESRLCTVSYDELTVYNVESYWDDDEEDYLKYDVPAFAFSNADGDYYDVGKILPDSRAGKMLAQKMKEHNIKAETIKSIEVLDNENSGD